MKKKVAIIGGGTASLFLAAFLDSNIFEVTIFEKKNTLGRKFLVAGDGGFNLTHSEELAVLKSRYTPCGFFDDILAHFGNVDLRKWLLGLGIPTFVGTSGRVFPEKHIKPIQVLKAMEAHLIKNKVKWVCNKTFSGWNEENALLFDGQEVVQSDYVVFGLGGASWKITGSDGAWLDIFKQKGIDTVPFVAANCACKIDWQPEFIDQYAGTPLKNIAVSLGDKVQKGEAVLTKFGIEGNAIYSLSPQIQADLTAKKMAIVYIDFKPALDLPTLIDKIRQSKSNVTTALKENIKLPRVVLDLLKMSLTKAEFLDIAILAQRIKKFPLTISDFAPIDEAISTAGGVSLAAINANFELKTLKNHFCIGEMLDWNAPTGGYLIQACASMGVYLANHFNNVLIG